LGAFGLISVRLSSRTHGAEEEEGFVPLFDGKTLSGWKKAGGGATYRVEDGCVVGEVGPGANTFLCTEKTFGDFILKLEAKFDVPGNSGIQFRSHQRENGRVFGYQFEIDPSDRAYTGGIYDEARRGWLFPLADKPEARKAFKRDDWNVFVIEARGPRLRTWVNGVACADLIDTMDLEGFIALQVHAGRQGRIRWKNIRIKELGKSQWQPLWDGKTFEGWRQVGGGKWSIENGEIVGANVKPEPQHGHLITKDQFTNFAIRLKFKATQGNSGLYFRVEEGGFAGVKGFQAEIDPQNDVGGLYETDGRAWIVKPKPEDVKKWLKVNDWNEMSVVALGDRLVVHVNGYKTADIVDDKGRKQGYIALQLHGGQDVDVRFKDVEILMWASERRGL
jgi:hypothetical protein